MSQEILDRLVTSRQRAWNEAKELLERAQAEGRDLSGEETAKWEAINADLDAKDSQIRTMVDRLRNEREADIAREAYAPVVAPAAEGISVASSDAAFEDFLRGRSSQRVWDIDFTAVDLEKKAIRAGASGAELRDLTVGTTTAGGHTVPTDLVRAIYTYMENVSGVRRAGATVITTAGGNNLDLPTVTAAGTAAIVGEGTALAEADPAFGKITLGAYKYGQLIQVSAELLADTGVDLVGFLGRDFGRALGRATEAHFIAGSGSNQPQGACNAAVVGTGVTTQTVATGVPSYANIVDLVFSVEDVYRDGGASFLMQDSFRGVIRKLTDTAGNPIWQPTVAAGVPDTLLGYPIFTTPFLTAVGTAAGTPMAFGNWAEGYVIRDVGSIRVEQSGEYAFDKDLVTWRAVLRTDAKVRDQKAINVAKAPTT
jgi:HK97 family phage major capsid protein